MDIPYTKHTLENGLDVLVHEDHTCPIVAVSVWYHVGSKNERPGHTGFAHLFEHLMFEGSQHHDQGYFRPLQAAGAAVNGSTNTDRTNYWEVVPTNALDLALWMESDRMAYLLPALTQAKFENQRDVVLNERRQNYENRPYGLAGMALVAALYPPDHPYHWPTIGEADDLRAARLNEVHQFFKTYYHPGNASLAFAGDVDTDHAIALAQRYFEEIARGPVVPPVDVPGAVAPPDGKRGWCSRTGSSYHACTCRGAHRRCSRKVTQSWICSPTSWRAGKPRACTASWFTTVASRPTSQRHRTPASSGASSMSWRPPRRVMTSPSSSR